MDLHGLLQDSFTIFTLIHKLKPHAVLPVGLRYSLYLTDKCPYCKRPEGEEFYQTDRLCGLVVIILGYRSGGPGSIPGTTRKKK
jgi:hypothetical protein